MTPLTKGFVTGRDHTFANVRACAVTLRPATQACPRPRRRRVLAARCLLPWCTATTSRTARPPPAVAPPMGTISRKWSPPDTQRRARLQVRPGPRMQARAPPRCRCRCRCRCQCTACSLTCSRWRCMRTRAESSTSSPRCRTGSRFTFPPWLLGPSVVVMSRTLAAARRRPKKHARHTWMTWGPPVGGTTSRWQTLAPHLHGCTCNHSNHSNHSTTRDRILQMRTVLVVARTHHPNANDPKCRTQTSSQLHSWRQVSCDLPHRRTHARTHACMHARAENESNGVFSWPPPLCADSRRAAGRQQPGTAKPSKSPTLWSSLQSKHACIAAVYVK